MPKPLLAIRPRVPSSRRSRGVDLVEALQVLATDLEQSVGKAEPRLSLVRDDSPPPKKKR